MKCVKLLDPDVNLKTKDKIDQVSLHVQIHAFEITGAFVPPRAALARLPHPPNVTSYEAIVGVREVPASVHGLPGIDILRFINEDLKVTAEDTLIVKMDIEGAEVGEIDTPII